MPELHDVVRGKYEILAQMLRSELEEYQIEKCFQVLQNLPLINVSLALQGQWQTSENQSQADTVSIDTRSKAHSCFSIIFSGM